MSFHFLSWASVLCAALVAFTLCLGYLVLLNVRMYVGMGKMLTVVGWQGLPVSTRRLGRHHDCARTIDAEVLGGIAELEWELIRARTAEARERASARGVKLGRGFKLTVEQQRQARARLDAGETSREIARTFNAAHTTPEDALKDAEATFSAQVQAFSGRITCLYS